MTSFERTRSLLWRCLCAALLAAAGPGCVPVVADTAPREAPMTAERLQQEIEAIGAEVSRSSNVVRFTFEGVELVCVFDPVHDRMRLVAPIGSIGDLTSIQVANILEANFHTALDARYATSDGVLYAAFIHPLGPLSAHELHSGVRQVASLVHTFGTSYSSGELQFGPGGPPQDAQDEAAEIPL